MARHFGIDVNYLGEAGYTCANFTSAALEKAGRDLTVDSFINAMESVTNWHDIFGGPACNKPDQPPCLGSAFLSVVRNRRWTGG